MAQEWEAEFNVLAKRWRVAHKRYNKAIAANINAMRPSRPGIVPRQVTAEREAASQALDDAKRALNDFIDCRKHAGTPP